MERVEYIWYAAFILLVLMGLKTQLQRFFRFLFMTGELKKRRSLWMVVGFVGILVCLLVSLICNYPSPLT